MGLNQKSALRYFSFFTAFVGLGVFALPTNEARADWCRDQGVVCVADPFASDGYGNVTGPLVVQNALNRISTYLNDVCLGGAQRLREQRRNLCGNQFISHRLDQIEFISDRAVRSLRLPRSGFRIVQDCSVLKLQVSMRALNSLAGLSFFRQTIERTVPEVAPLSQSQLSLASAQAQIRFARRSQFHPRGSRYEPVVSWDLYPGPGGRIIARPGQTFLTVPAEFFLASSLPRDRDLPRIAVTQRCLLESRIQPPQVERPENLGFPPLSSNMHFPSEQVRECVYSEYRYFWEYAAYQWRESVAYHLVQTNRALLDFAIADLNPGFASIARPRAPLPAAEQAQCMQILASHPEIPLEMRFDTLLKDLRAEAERFINPSTRTYDVDRLHRTGFRERLEEVRRWCIHGDPCFCKESKMFLSIINVLRPYGEATVREFENELNSTISDLGPAFQTQCQADLTDVFGNIWNRLRTPR